MWTPSKASGAVPMQTASMSSMVSSAASSAVRAASQASSLPVSSDRRTKRVIPAPTTPTRRPIASGVRRQNGDGTAGGGDAAPRLGEATPDGVDLAGAGLALELGDHVGHPGESVGFEEVPAAE